MTTSDFIHLRVHSAYSLSEGAIPIKTLVELCKGQNMPAVAVTDTNNLFGALEFSGAAAKIGIQPIIGIQLAIEYETGTDTSEFGAGNGFSGRRTPGSGALCTHRSSGSVGCSWWCSGKRGVWRYSSLRTSSGVWRVRQPA